MTDKIKELEAMKATIDNETERRETEQKIRQLEEQRRKNEMEQARLKTEEDTRKLEVVAQQLKEDEAKKSQDELERKKAEEEKARLAEVEKKRAEAARTKPGDQVALNEVTVAPAKISGSAPAVSSSMRTKYRGKTMTVPTTILVDENGKVEKVKILTGNVPGDIKMLIEETLNNWKYSPAQKDNVNVKVWLSVPFKFTF